MLDHEHIKGCHCTVEGLHNDLKRTLVIHTDLEVDGSSANYDHAKLEDLIAYASDYLKRNSELHDAMRIVNR